MEIDDYSQSLDLPDDGDEECLLPFSFSHPDDEAIKSMQDCLQDTTPRIVKKFKNVRKSNCFKCAVCGDKPTGYHYDVMSCNGCKTFFRRTIIGGRTFTCLKGGQCEFTKDFRCSCRACRYDKCVKAGMNPDAIVWPANMAEGGGQRKTLSYEDEEDDEINEATTSTAIVRKRKTPAAAPQSRLSIVKTPTTPDFEYMGVVDDLMKRMNSMDELRNNFSLYAPTGIFDALKSPLILCSPSYQGRLQRRGSYLVKTYEANPVRHWMVSDLHLIVEYAKTFPAFRELSTNDQYSLLFDVGSILLLIVQARYSYKNKYFSTVFPDGTSALEHVHEKSNIPFVDRLFCVPTESLHDLEMDEETCALVLALLLFSPASDALSDAGREVITKERYKYCDTLSRLLLCAHGPAQIEKYMEIHSAIQRLYKLGEDRRRQMILFDVTKRYALSEIERDFYLGLKS